MIKIWLKGVLCPFVSTGIWSRLVLFFITTLLIFYCSNTMMAYVIIMAFIQIWVNHIQCNNVLIALYILCGTSAIMVYVVRSNRNSIGFLKEWSQALILVIALPNFCLFDTVCTKTESNAIINKGSDKDLSRECPYIWHLLSPQKYVLDRHYSLLH